MLSRPSVAIVLLNFNNLDYLQKNLGYLNQLTYSDYKVYIIDNASEDGSLEYIQENHPSFRIISLDKNYGYAEGYNKGLSQIKEDYYCLLNTDVEVSPGFLEPVIDLMKQNEKIGICQPKLLSQQRRNYFEYAGGSGGWIDALGYTFTRGRILDYQEEDIGQYDNNSQIFWASGACFIIKAPLFHELKGFNNYFFMYSEEVDLCWRAQLLGYQVYVCPLSKVYHKETIRLQDQNAQRIYYIFRNNLIMLHQNLPFTKRMTLIPFRFALNVVAALVFFTKGHFRKSFKIGLAHLHYLRWAFQSTPKATGPKKALKDLCAVYKGSVLFGYYFQGKRTFKEFTKEDKC